MPLLTRTRSVSKDEGTLQSEAAAVTHEISRVYIMYKVGSLRLATSTKSRLLFSGGYGACSESSPGPCALNRIDPEAATIRSGWHLRCHGIMASLLWHRDLLRHLLRQCLVLILVGRIGQVARLDQTVVTAASAGNLRQTHRRTDLDITRSSYTSRCTRTHDCSAGRWLRRI